MSFCAEGSKSRANIILIFYPKMCVSAVAMACRGFLAKKQKERMDVSWFLREGATGVNIGRLLKADIYLQEYLQVTRYTLLSSVP